VTKLPGDVRFSRFLKAMGRFGWTVARVKGSHHQLLHEGVANVITVYASHGTISRPLMKKILKDARIDEDDFAAEL